MLHIIEHITDWQTAHAAVRTLERGFVGETKDGQEVILGYDPVWQYAVAFVKGNGDTVATRYVREGMFFAEWREFVDELNGDVIAVFTDEWKTKV